MKKLKIQLSPDYCCGGGHCGPLPGYFFTCPECNQESNCRTGYELEIGENLICFLCKAKFPVNKKYSEFVFDIEV